MRIDELMTRDPVACEATDTAQDVARLMLEKGVGFVVVLDEGRVAGVVTDRDLAVGVMAEGLDADEVLARDLMTQSPARAREDDTLLSVVAKLRGAGVVRRLPVVNAQNELVGVVSLSDLAVVAKELLDAILLEETRHALHEAHVPTGGKELRKLSRSPRRNVARPPAIPVRRSSVKHE